MKRIAALSLVLAACGSAPRPPVHRGPPHRRAGREGCAADEALVAGVCWNAEGSAWSIEAAGPGGDYRFDVVLLAANRARSTDHPEASPATDEWFQEGPVLRVLLGDRFVEYRARITNGTMLLGEASNVRGQRWAWRGSRVFGERACRDDEATLAGSCMSIAGTRWELRREGAPEVLIEFGAGGVLATGPRDEDRGTWSQSGATVRFAIEGRELAFELDGTREARGPRFHLTRVESIPP